jgi:hypothetical protein
VELMLQLPPRMSGAAGVTVLCGGYIVRVVEPKAPLGDAALAAAFVDFRLLYPSHRTQARLRQAERAINREPQAAFIHGFNNALTVILGNCELQMDRAELDPVARESFLRIREAAERAAALFRDSFGVKPR